MGILNRFVSLITGVSAELPDKPAEAFREAAGFTVDADEADWRRLSGDAKRDLEPMTQDRMQELAAFLWRRNMIANRLIEVPCAYLLGKGVSITLADPESHKDVQRHWKDGINNWRIKLLKRIRELALFGEQVWPVFLGVDNFVRVGYLDPKRIGTVVMDPDNAEQPIGIVTKKNNKGQSKRYRVIVNCPETAFSPRTQQIRETFTDGDAFFFRVNELCNSTRGCSDLTPATDWIDAYEEFLFGEMERANMTRAFIWDVMIKGATPEEVAERAKKITAPRAGSVRVHNEAEEWTAESPTLGAYESAVGAKLFRNHILGGLTIPEHWFGGAADVNRATGDSMGEPTEKMFEARQAYVGYMLTELVTYVLRVKWGALDRELKDSEHDILDGLTIQWPEMTSKDTTKYASALQQTVAAASLAVQEGLITKGTAVALVSAVAKQLGVDFDPETELQDAIDERAMSGDNFDDPIDDEEEPELDADGKPVAKPKPTAAEA